MNINDEDWSLPEGLGKRKSLEEYYREALRGINKRRNEMNQWFDESRSISPEEWKKFQEKYVSTPMRGIQIYNPDQAFEKELRETNWDAELDTLVAEGA